MFSTKNNLPLKPGVIRDLNFNEKVNILNNWNSRYFLRFIQLLNQIISFFKIETDNEEILKRQNAIFESCYVNGFTVLTFKNNKVQIWSIAGDCKFDINGDLEFVDVIPYIEFGNKQVNNFVEPIRLKGNECVVIKSGWFGLSLLVITSKLINDNVDLMEIYLTNSKLNIKKLLMIINNEAEQIVNEEIQSILDPKSPIIKSINPISKYKENNDIREVSGEQNIIQTLDLSNSGGNGFEDVKNHWVFETNLMGFFADEYHKKERVSAGENEISQANTILIHETLLREWKKAEIEIKQKFNINVKFVKTFAFDNDDNEKENKENNKEVKNEI